MQACDDDEWRTRAGERWLRRARQWIVKIGNDSDFLYVHGELMRKAEGTGTLMVGNMSYSQQIIHNALLLILSAR